MTNTRAQDLLNQANAASKAAFAPDNDAALEDFIASTDITSDEKDEALSRSTTSHPGVVGGLRHIAQDK